MPINPFAKFKLVEANAASNKNDPVYRYRKVLTKAVSEQIAYAKSDDVVINRAAWFSQTANGWTTPIKYCKKNLVLFATQKAFDVCSRTELVDAYLEVIHNVNAGYFDQQLTDFANATTKAVRKAA